MVHPDDLDPGITIPVDTPPDGAQTPTDLRIPQNTFSPLSLTLALNKRMAEDQEELEKRARINKTRTDVLARYNDLIEAWRTTCIPLPAVSS